MPGGTDRVRGAQPWRTNRARALRSQHVSAEEKLWSEQRDRPLGGFKFVRQAPVGPYFADFLSRRATSAHSACGRIGSR
ncbi:MAG: DUF559 domain-containing protein [bacterium]